MKYLITICPPGPLTREFAVEKDYSKDEYAIRAAKKLAQKTPGAYWKVENITGLCAIFVADPDWPTKEEV